MPLRGDAQFHQQAEDGPSGVYRSAVLGPMAEPWALETRWKHRRIVSVLRVLGRRRRQTEKLHMSRSRCERKPVWKMDRGGVDLGGLCAGCAEIRLRWVSVKVCSGPWVCCTCRDV